MADINTSGGGRHESKLKAKKMSTRVDFTPMVDLAFLLISFFMLTTTLNDPVAMQLAMPKPIEDGQEDAGEDVKESQVLTIIIDKDAVWYYEGIPEEITTESLQQTHFGPSGLRQVILAKQDRVEAAFGDKEKTICLIKMTEEAYYNDMVSALDEMDITKTKIFAIQELSEGEELAVIGTR